MPLLERARELAVLRRLLDEVVAGQGRVALVSGEAGIGKSSLVSAFVAEAAEHARILEGACEDLLAPQAFAPFRDMASGPSSPLRRALVGGAQREAMLAAIREEAADPLSPVVMVVEDVHWADDATIDALRLLGRRIETISCLLVLTYREEEVGDGHPLLRVLGALAGDAVARLPLQRLSAAAVQELAAAHADAPADLHRITGGNPFFVTEVLQFPDREVPPTVRDAVLARLRLLDESTRTALEHLSVLSGRTPWSVVERVGGLQPEALAEAEARGFLAGDAREVWFRHEIIRRTIEQTLPAWRRLQQHSAVLDALLETGGTTPRLLHHAVEADRGDVLASRAPAAAREASRLGGHRQAAFLYQQALRWPELLEPVARAQCRRRLAYELVLVNRTAEAVVHAARAVAEEEEIGNATGLGIALITASHACYWALDPAGALSAATRAIEVLEAQKPGSALAMAHAQLAWTYLMGDRYAEAERHARRALALAEERGGEPIRAHALAQLGGALLMLGDATGEEHASHALELARSVGHHEYATLACMLLVSGLFSQGRLTEAERYMDVGIAYAQEHELDVGAATLVMMRGGLSLARGEWTSAEADFRTVLRGDPAPGWGETVAQTLLGRLLARRGDSGAAEHLERAWSIAERSGEVKRIGPAGAALAEWAWLTGDVAAVTPRVRHALQLSARAGHRWYEGEIARYFSRAGADVSEHRDAAEPWASGLRGDPQRAAEQWERSGWRYEQALELTDCADEEAALEGLRILDELGAEAAARLVRMRLRERGVTRIPRGPTRTTRTNPAGLTARQVEVLALLAEGLTNAEIADRLVLSVRTVDHHVSAILDKLGVSSRQEAATAARELQIDLTSV